jgi:tetratricopeptide (TPR) repeat protein
MPTTTPRALRWTASTALCALLGVAVLRAEKPALPDAVLNPLAPRPATVSPTLPEPGPPIDLDHYENPLLLFDGAGGPPVDPAWKTDLLTPLAPMPEEEPAPEPSAEEKRLLQLGARVAASVAAVRVCDKFGALLAIGIGSYVSPDGVLLTDAGLLHPEIAERVDYVTLQHADGTSSRVRGFYHVDLVTGIALLQSEESETEPIALAPGRDFTAEQEAHVLAVSEKRGLVLASARVQADAAVTGLGWLNVRGEDSPGAVGSPVLDAEGRLTALIALAVPLKNWKNFALPADAAALLLRETRAPLRPLTELPRRPGLREVTNEPAFAEAFRLLEQKRFTAALRKLLPLARRYPRSAECWALLGLNALHLNAGPEALNCQRKAVALDPTAGLYWHQLAVSRMRAGTEAPPAEDEDREALQLAVDQQPNDAQAWLLLAGHLARAGDLTAADDALRRTTLLAPENARAHYLLACVRGKLGDHDGAQTAVRRSLSIAPDQADAWFYQGLLQTQRGEHAEAAKSWQRTVRLQPRHPQAWLNLAHAQRKAGRETEARQAILEHQKVRVQAAR